MIDPTELRRLDLFERCDDDELEGIAAALARQDVHPGEVLIREGDSAARFDVIAAGHVRVSHRGPEGDEELAVVGPGSFVGELSLLEGTPCSATVTAVDDVTVYWCSAADFGRLLAAPSVQEAIVQSGARRLRANRAAVVPPVLVALPDGTPLALRPVHFNDWRNASASIERLSTDSLYRRFFTVPKFTNAMLMRLADVDYVRQFAWVALAVDEPGQPGVGVGRYVHDGSGPVAELAFTVIDDYQGRGLGSLLFDALAAAARVNGISRFSALVLYDNRPMLRILERAGARFVADDDPGAVRCEFDVPTDPIVLDRAVFDELGHVAATVVREGERVRGSGTA